MSPNLITSSRFLFGILMALSAFFGNIPLFISFYCFALISDVLDGFLARKLKKQTEYGKKLDIAADTFIVVCVGISLFFFKKIRYIEIFSIIIIYYILVQIASLIYKRMFVFHRSVSANLAAVVFPFLVFAMLYSEVIFLAYTYSALMIYSLTEKLFLILKTKKNIWFYLIFLAFVALIVLIPKNSGNKVCFEDLCIDVEIMDSNEERALGLMYRSNLDEKEGMLFVFEKQGYYQFYMKNMLIPIDMIFIDENMKIVKIHERVQPCKAEPCELYSADVPIKYVIEVKDGFSKRNFIMPGSEIKFRVV